MSAMVDVVLRLLAAVAIGIVLGLNRDMQGKPTGMRTLGLVSLGACVVMLGLTHPAGVSLPVTALARIVQGVVTGVLSGIGFLGGGVILLSESGERVRNVTTAATVWVTAALGLTCGFADWRILGIGFALIVLVLVFGRSGEGWVSRRLGRPLPGDED